MLALSAGGVAMPRGVVALGLILAAADRGDAVSVAGWFDAASASVALDHSFEDNGWQCHPGLRAG